MLLFLSCYYFFFFKQKTAYEMRISDWSSDVCSSDLVLYCDLGPAAPLGTDTRRAYRSVLDVLFHALVRYAAPVLVFTSEEVWGTRYPEAGSVHLLEWPNL